MLSLRTALKNVLGSSFTIMHVGPQGSVPVTVNVGDYGTGETLPLPCVLFLGQTSTTDPADIGGHGVENRTTAHYHILTIQAADGSWDPVQMLDDIQLHVEAAIRAQQTAIGNSYFTLASSSRDLQPTQQMASEFWWTRWVAARGQNLEHF